MNILITGKPGVGKTTLIQKVLDNVELTCQGFYTREIRADQGNRLGFEIVTLDGKTALLAHSQHLSPYRVHIRRVGQVPHEIMCPGSGAQEYVPGFP